MVVLPISCGIGGALLRTALLVAFRVWHSDCALLRAVTFDPLSIWLAEEGLTLLFDRRGIGPSTAQVRFYEVFLALGAALQCLVLGIAVQAGLIVLRRRHPPAP
jgi:hypothetical protein